MRSKPTHIWVFNPDRRVYPKPERGRIWSSGGPIWREHWEKRAITGETSRSWVLDTGRKVPKVGADPREIAFTEDAIDRAAYVHDNAHRIGDAVRGLRDYDTLKAVADLIGWTRTQ